MTTKAYENKTKFEARQRERGFVKAEIWVPADRAGELKEVARKMREGEA